MHRLIQRRVAVKNWLMAMQHSLFQGEPLSLPHPPEVCCSLNIMVNINNYHHSSLAHWAGVWWVDELTELPDRAIHVYTYPVIYRNYVSSHTSLVSGSGNETSMNIRSRDNSSVCIITKINLHRGDLLKYPPPLTVWWSSGNLLSVHRWLSSEAVAIYYMPTVDWLAKQWRFTKRPGDLVNDQRKCWLSGEAVKIY